MGERKTKTLKLVVSYNGAHFKGWQLGNGRTVQSVLEEALGLSLGTASKGAVKERSPVRVNGAGRTDAGVHAIGQVASAVVPMAIDPVLLLDAVNHNLTSDVAVRSVEEVDDRFHARYRALSKTYRYTIVDGAAGVPFLHRFSWRIDQVLDVASMAKAAEGLIGTHDFSAFTAAKGKKDKTRTIHSIDFAHRDLYGAKPLEITICGDAFLWNQVRVVVAALVAVGVGESDAAAVGGILNSRDRAQAPAPAPARGLTLLSVEYPAG